MSVKAMSLVWDFPCPMTVNGVEFKPSHKFCLLAYADHADHNGKNIFPAVGTVAKKTGLDERTVQRLTADMSDMCLLLDDGKGPRGTNRWSLPYSAGGDKLSPPSNCRGDKNAESLGDIPSGDISSGDKLSPELKEPKPTNTYSTDETVTAAILEGWNQMLETLEGQMSKKHFLNLKPSEVVHFGDGVLQVMVENDALQEWLESRLQQTVERTLLGILNQQVHVQFVSAETEA